MTGWDTALPDWEQRIERGQSLIPDLPLHESEAERGLRIFRRLRLPDVYGKPTLGEAFGPWVMDLVAAVFGAFDPATHRRALQEFFLLVPKKNGKSTLSAGILITAVLVNKRPSAEVLMIAPTKTIADIAFGQAKGMIEADPELQLIFEVREHIRTIEHPKSKARIEIKAADTDVITGGKPTYMLVDETHEFSKKSKAADIFVELRGALAARPDGFMIQITTQSKEPPAGVFKQELEIARAVRDGKIRLPMLPVLYELPKRLAAQNGWKDPATWPLVNPNLGRSVDPVFLQNQLLAAENKSDAKAALTLLASQHFNVEIGVGLRTDSWIGAEYWEQSTDPTITLETLLERCEVIVMGGDGGGLDDLFGLAVLGREAESRDWLLWVHAWAQPDVFERRKDIASKLRDFEAEGSLTVCETPTQDIEEIAALAARINDTGLLAVENAIGLDPQGVAALIDALDEAGLSEKQMAGVSQGYRLHGSILGMERKLKDGTLWHAEQKLMNWVVGNAKTELRGNAVLITKQVSGKAKIDPLMASFNAVFLMSRNPAGQGFVTGKVAVV